MDYVLPIVGFIMIILGIIGCLIPVLPGTPLAWLGLLLLYLTKGIPIDWWILGITLLITVILYVLEYIIPSQGTKYFGGSKYGIWGTNIGLIIGILAPIPLGFIIGPFVGALLGELLYDSQNHKRALKAATGSFVGFLASTFMSFITCIIFLGLFIIKAWEYKTIWI